MATTDKGFSDDDVEGLRSHIGILLGQKKRLRDMVDELATVIAPTLKSEMRLTQEQSSARIRARALLKEIPEDE